MSTPAEVKRKALEISLIEAYQWTPQQIAEIPYAKLQELLIMLEVKNEAKQHQSNVEKAKQEVKSGNFKRQV